jgi:hypothetical protein
MGQDPILCWGAKSTTALLSAALNAFGSALLRRLGWENSEKPKIPVVFHHSPPSNVHNMGYPPPILEDKAWERPTRDSAKVQKKCEHFFLKYAKIFKWWWVKKPCTSGKTKRVGNICIYIYSSRHWLVTLVKLSLPFMAYPVNGWTKIMVIQLFTTEPNRCLSSRACKFFAQCSAAPGSPSKASSKQVGSWTAEDSAAITVRMEG